MNLEHSPARSARTSYSIAAIFAGVCIIGCLALCVAYLGDVGAAFGPNHSPLTILIGLSTAGLDRAAYTVSEFCEAHRISRSKLYELWQAGIGPAFKNIGTKKIITVEAAADWRRQSETISG